MPLRLPSRLFARLLRLASRYHEPLIAARKRRLLAPLSGRILEIGPGDGVNLQYYSPGIHWTAYEPNPHLASRIPVPAQGQLIIAPFPDPTRHHAPFDYIVCTLVLCSVPKLPQILQALHQVLAPGGKLIFLEHVAGPPGSPLHQSQHRWRGPWGFCAGGCDPTRDTAAHLASAGFVFDELEHFSLPLSLASPHIAGIARKSPTTTPNHPLA